jgi:hypothetical protein
MVQACNHSSSGGRDTGLWCEAGAGKVTVCLKNQLKGKGWCQHQQKNLSPTQANLDFSPVSPPMNFRLCFSPVIFALLEVNFCEMYTMCLDSCCMWGSRCFNYLLRTLISHCVDFAPSSQSAGCVHMGLNLSSAPMVYLPVPFYIDYD